MVDIDTRFTFDAFVVGPANRLAAAAAKRSAESPGESYNPLFVYSASGLGKSHILGAISHHVGKVHPDLAVVYLTLETYLEELAQSLEAGQKDALRDRYRELDILLLDDVQFLAGQTEAQEMLLSTLDALSGAGKQAVLASDRPPAEIDRLDARLLSRFEGGLLVDIGTPEYETRVAIIRKRADERKTTLEQGIAEAIAKVPYQNVRELGGALNRVIAIQDLEDIPAPSMAEWRWASWPRSWAWRRRRRTSWMTSSKSSATKWPLRSRSRKPPGDSSSGRRPSGRRRTSSTRAGSGDTWRATHLPITSMTSSLLSE